MPILLSMYVGILAAVSYSTYIDALAVNIKLELVPLGKQCDTGRVLQIRIRINR